MRLRAEMEQILSRHTGQTVERLREDTGRDLVLTAQEAVAYGLADGVLERSARPASASGPVGRVPSARVTRPVRSTSRSPSAP